MVPHHFGDIKQRLKFTLARSVAGFTNLIKPVGSVGDVLGSPGQKILVIMTSGIGNMILFVPTLRELRRRFQKSQITILVEPRGTREILQGCPYVDEIIVMEFGSRFERWRLLRGLRNEHYNMVIVSFTSQNLDNAFLGFLTGAPVRVGYDIQDCAFLYTHRIPFAYGRHEVELNLDILRALGTDVDEGKKELELWISPGERETGREILHRYGIREKELLVGFHPGSHHDLAYKRWPQENFAQLGDMLIEKYDARVLLFGSLDELEVSQRLESVMSNRPILLTGKLSLRETLAVVAECGLFVSNDSGLMHVAAALRVPMVGIFGPTIPSKNAPYGDEDKCVAMSKNLPCSPCYRMYERFNCDTLECLKSISAGEVLNLIDQKFLGANRRAG